MTTQELRKKLINRINQLEDDSLLQDVIKLIESDFDDNQIYKISDAHKSAVNEGIDQIENGEFLSNDESNELIDKWLSK